jgi:hypothetical protein
MSDGSRRPYMTISDAEGTDPRKTEAFAVASGLFRGAEVVAEFVSSQVRSWVPLSLVKDNCGAVVFGQFLRIDAWLRTLRKLAEPADFQAVAAAGCGLFEATIDIALLHHQPQDHERVLAWERSAKLKHGEGILAYLARSRDTAPAEYPAVAAFVARQKTEIEKVRKKLGWIRKDRTTRHPERWTNRSLSDDAKRVDKLGHGFGFENFYETEYRKLCWHAHGSALPFRSVTFEHFPGIAGLIFPACGDLGLVASEIVLRHLGAWTAEREQAFSQARNLRFVVAAQTAQVSLGPSLELPGKETALHALSQPNALAFAEGDTPAIGGIASCKGPVHRAIYHDARTGSSEHPSLISDPIPRYIYKKMEKRWALRFAEGSVKIGSLFCYRYPTFLDDSGMIVDPHEGLEVAEITEELVKGSPMPALLARGKPLRVGSLVGSEDNRRLVFCASESASIPPEALPREYDTWVQIEAKPAIDLIHRALLKLVPDLEGPVFKRVIYDQTIDGHDDRPPLRPFFTVLGHGFGLHDRWFTKRTKFQAQAEVRIGWLADPKVCTTPIRPLDVPGLGSFVKVLD